MVTAIRTWGRRSQFVWGMTSCSEWTGVPLSVLLDQVGVQQGGNWLVYEGADPGKFSHTLPLAKALDDVFVAYGQNGEPVRVEQGYPIRMIVPGWEGPFSVKYLKHIKVVDEPYHDLERSYESLHPESGPGRQIALVPFPMGNQISDYAAFSRTGTTPQRICANYRLGLVRWRRDKKGRSVHRRRPDLEGREAPGADTSEGTHPVCV